MTKIAYYSTVSHRKVAYNHEKSQKKVDDCKLLSDDKLSSSCDANDSESHNNYKVYKSARLHFIKFETKYIESCLDFIRGNLTGSKEFMRGKSIKATGGGAYKYAELIQEKLGLA